MTFDMALKVFDIKADELDKDTLKKKYRVLSMKHHPDRGGSLQMMQDVNDAYAVLSKSDVNSIASRASSQSREEERVKFRDKYRMAGTAIKTSLLSNFQPEVFLRYFENESGGKKFTHEITKVWPTDSQMTGKWAYPNSAGFNVEFFTSNRDTVFHLDVHVDLLQVVFPEAVLGNANITWNTYTNTYGFHMNKKQKFAQRDWSFTRDNSFFRKPEILFPSKKLKAIFSGETSKRAFKKRDMETFIKLKLKGDLQNEWAYIPVGDEYQIAMWRSVFMKKGSWSIHGLYKGRASKANKVSGKFASFLETEDTAIELKRIQDALMRTSDSGKAAKFEQLIDRAQKAHNEYIKNL